MEESKLKELNDLVMVEVSAEAHHSSQTASAAVIITRSFYESNHEKFTDVYFSELDGKHSQTEGEWCWSDLFESNLQEVISTLLNTDHDDYIIWDDMMSDTDKDQLEIQKEIHSAFMKRISQKTVTVTVCYLDDESV